MGPQLASVWMWIEIEQGVGLNDLTAPRVKYVMGSKCGSGIRCGVSNCDTTRGKCAYEGTYKAVKGRVLVRLETRGENWKDIIEKGPRIPLWGPCITNPCTACLARGLPRPCSRLAALSCLY
jgi:hypothetical protein